MNRFEFYTMIFYVLDHYWDKNGGEELGNFLSDMSPFTFDGIGSANPAIYEEFCQFVKDELIDPEVSYALAMEYVNHLNKECVREAFMWVTQDDWIGKCKKSFE